MSDFDWESQLLEENKTLRQIISDMANEELADASKYKKLKDSVDKAIDEINDIAYIGFCAESLGNKVLVFKDDVLEIIKRNIGEQV